MTLSERTVLEVTFSLMATHDLRASASTCHISGRIFLVRIYYSGYCIVGAGAESHRIDVSLTTFFMHDVLYYWTNFARHY